MARAARLVLALAFLTGPPFAREAVACECNPTPACAAFWRAEAVFTGTVVEQPMERLGGKLSWTVSKISVERVYRGTVDPFTTMVPSVAPTADQVAQSMTLPGESAAGISSCDYGFQTGRKYLIFAFRTSDGRWTTSLCSGTKPIGEALADLQFIESIPTLDPIGHVFGSVRRTVGDLEDPARASAVAGAGIKISLVGDARRIIAVTDAQGMFDATVPPGKYTVWPLVAGTEYVYGSSEATVAARGCAQVDFSIAPRR